MKTCGYCGRENEDGAGTCAECGTELEEAPIVSRKSKARRNWPDLRLRYAGYTLALALFYFLSFGPVMYFFSKVTSTSATVGSTYTTTVTVELPTWAGVIYYPAFGLYSTRWANETYGRYVRWWMERGKGKN